MKCCKILKYVMEKSTDAFQRALYEFGDEKNREAFTPLKDFVLCKTVILFMVLKNNFCDLHYLIFHEAWHFYAGIMT